MKKILLGLFLILLYSNFIIGQEKHKFTIEEINYPIANLNYKALLFTQENINKLDSLNFQYPKLARQKYWQNESNYLVELDSNNYVKNIEFVYKENDCELLDTIGIKILSSIKAFKFDSNKTYYDYQLKDSSRRFKLKLVFKISFDSLEQNIIFNNILVFKKNDTTDIAYFVKTDSSNTFESFYRNNLKKNYSNKYYHMPHNNKLALLGIYGRCKLGFWVDTSGNISNLEVLKSTHEKIEKEALKNFHSLPFRWIPARENGIKQKTYKELTLRFGYDEAIYTKIQSKKYLENVKPEKAIKELEDSKMYFDDDISLLIEIIKLKSKFKKYETICNDLEEIKYIAIDNYYPMNVSESKVDELIKIYCPKTQE